MPARNVSLPRLAAAWPWVGLGLVLLWGAWWRFSWPLWPVADADTWGYLNPGLSKLNGSGFEHTLGRNFVYPGFLWLVLRLTGDFRAITIIQHALGLGSGWLLWLFWRRWISFFPRPAGAKPAVALTLAGLVLVGFYEGSASNFAFEHYLRPEAIFPFFAILDLLLMLEFIQAWFRQRRVMTGGLLALAMLLIAALLYQLKPSFGLALGVVVLPWLAAWFFPGRSARAIWRARGSLALAAAMAVGLTVGLFTLPEKVFSRGDRWSTLFLPETLLTIHADLLRDQMAADLRAGRTAPYDPGWLARNYADLAREVDIASTPERLPFRSLGFNPDYLLYSDVSFCHRLNEQLVPAEAAAFAFHFYARAWEARPLVMLRKVGRQLGLFYNLHCPAYWPIRTLEMAYFYQKTANSFLYPEYQRRMALYPPAQRYLEAARAWSQSPARLQLPGAMVTANNAASVSYTVVLGLFLAGLAWAGRWRHSLLPAAVPVLLAYGFNAGCCVTIAIVHSLYGDRYSYNQLIFTALAQASALAWLGTAIFSKSPPANASHPPGCAAPLPRARALPPAGPTLPGRSAETLLR